MAELNNIEQEARQLGWVPKEEFKGDEDRWVDADAFVDRGKHIMPILQKNNERLQGQLRERDARLTKLEELLTASQESIAALEEHHTAATKKQVERARADLLAELKSARESNDVDAEVQIMDELTQIKTAQEEKPAAKKEEAKTAVTTDAPEVAAFKAANASWYGTDLKETVRFNRLAEDLRLEGNTQVGQPFLDTVMKRFEEGGRQTTSKVEGGKSGGGGGSGTKTGRTFASLSKEEKEACHADNKKLVGEGRRFKTVAEWEKRYTELLYPEEQ